MAAIDAGVATKLGNNYNEFIDNGHSNLKIEDWRAEFISELSAWKDKLPMLDMIVEWGENVGDWFSDVGDEILHWYHCEGGKEWVEFGLALAGVVVAVLLFVASIPASAVVGLFSAIVTTLEVVGAAIGVLNALTNAGTALTAAMIKTYSDDPGWARVYANMDTASDFLRISVTGIGVIDEYTDRKAAELDFLETVCALGSLANSLKGVGEYLNNAGKFSTYFKTVKWSNGEILTAMDDGKKVAQTEYTAQSVWRGIKAYICDLPIASDDTRGIRTIFQGNLLSDFKNSVAGLNPRNGLGVTLLFSKDEAKRQNAATALKRLIDQNTSFEINFSNPTKLKRTATNIKNYFILSNPLETRIRYTTNVMTSWTITGNF